MLSLLVLLLVLTTVRLTFAHHSRRSAGRGGTPMVATTPVRVLEPIPW